MQWVLQRRSGADCWRIKKMKKKHTQTRQHIMIFYVFVYCCKFCVASVVAFVSLYLVTLMLSPWVCVCLWLTLYREREKIIPYDRTLNMFFQHDFIFRAQKPRNEEKKEKETEIEWHLTRLHECIAAHERDCEIKLRMCAHICNEAWIWREKEPFKNRQKPIEWESFLCLFIRCRWFHWNCDKNMCRILSDEVNFFSVTLLCALRSLVVHKMQAHTYTLTFIWLPILHEMSVCVFLFLLREHMYSLCKHIQAIVQPFSLPNARKTLCEK